MRFYKFKYHFLVAVLMVGALEMLSTFIPSKRPPLGSFHVSEDHVFINYQQNRLQFFGEKERWNSMFERLEEIVFNGTGHISMVHIGGSHVQAGVLSDRMRSNLIAMTAGLEAERGFVFPYKLAGTNSPSSIHTKWTGNWDGCRCALASDNCYWGVSGINATTFDTIASVQLWVSRPDSSNYYFNEVKIFSPDASSQMAFTIPGSHEDISKLQDGYRTFLFDFPQDTLLIEIAKTDSIQKEFVLQGVYLGRKENGLTYNAIGVNGASTRSYLRCPQFFPQFAALDADLVIFGIGVNDANVPNGEFDEALYEARYDSLITGMRARNPNVNFLFITNNDTYYLKKRPNENALKVRSTMLRLASKYDGAVWDMFEIMGGIGSIKSWQNAGLAKSDKIHLTNEGYVLQADLMYQAFLESFGNYLDSKNPR